jgi:hypothetical protein
MAVAAGAIIHEIETEEVVNISKVITKISDKTKKTYL